MIPLLSWIYAQNRAWWQVVVKSRKDWTLMHVIKMHQDSLAAILPDPFFNPPYLPHFSHYNFDRSEPTLLDTANTSQRSKQSESVTTTRNLNSQELTMRSLNPSWWALASDLEASQESESEIWPEEIKATARPCHNHLENRSFFPSDPNISNDPQMQLCWQATLRFSFACVAWLCNDFEVWLTPDATASGPATSFASSLSLRWNRKSKPQAASRRSNPDYGAAIGLVNFLCLRKVSFLCARCNIGKVQLFAG